MQALPDANSSQHRPPGMVLMGNGGAEQGHKAIAEELVDGPLVAVHLAQGQVEELIEQRVHGLRAQALGQSRGVGQVAEEYGDLLALAFKGGTGGKDFFSQVPGSV
jgi:hypothetical protein